MLLVVDPREGTALRPGDELKRLPEHPVVRFEPTQLTGADGEWVRAHHDGPALLRQIDPRTGLTAADFQALAEWAQEVSQR